MKKILVISLLLFPVFKLFAQHTERQLDQLLSYSKIKQIDTTQFNSALKIFRSLETRRELDVAVRRSPNDDESSETVLRIFGTICLHSNSPKAVDEFIKFIKRQKGSADEEIPTSFEPLFAKWPDYVLIRIANDKDLLNQLEWGFVNNHFHDLTTKNCRTIFYSLNPKIKYLYPKYKKQIDYVISTAVGDLKS
ncbi:hypothetical protein [Mucilaginibacter sp.]|uniref:hypothetical protein n=1 Tax=Mucilaginibacter sp. TaxID=1882438 RepID=UPI002844F324|nr:hypothetical protein [Mucilaginibacter sp.]MDR3695843.1 hypothetical protein [Mucilaginibacter sp.]